jgi:D-alanine-D-alanine ligase
MSKDSAKQKQPPGRGSVGGPRSLGPVSDLELYVQAEWWRWIFDSTYLKTDADVVHDQAITSKEVDLFSDALKVPREAKILDLCCGQGRHALEFARRGYSSVDGFDRSHYLIQKAREQVKREGLAVKFREGDARKLPFPPDTFDAVMILGNSFGYFETIQDDVRVLKEVHRVLKPWGRLLVDVADGAFLRDHYQPRSWEWIDKKHFVCRERALSRDKQRLISREVVTHVEKGVVADQFYGERLYSADDLNQFLNGAGFSDVTSHGGLTPDSQRAQDLGMMERRIVLTATVRKEWTPVKKKGPEVRNVVVILGDPSKPDPLKPSCVFDEDDFYTIDQLKNALREIQRYNCTYIDNHDTMYHDLLKQIAKTDMVFNLCDEGFDNDPRRELHVPSMLETLGIPYTGSGPQTLAYCYDKSLVRGIAKEMDIPVPEAFFVKPEDSTWELPFPFPVIVKPNLGDSSFGITQHSVTSDVVEVTGAIARIRSQFGYEKPILVEEFLTGKDLSVGIIGNPPESYTVLPIIEEDYSQLPPDLPRLCGYEAKWVPDSPYFTIGSVRAQLPEETERFVAECSLKLFERLECRDYCRFDWRLSADGQPKLLEVNPNPGWCWDGHLAKMAGIAGISYVQMLEAILNAAEQRIGFAKEQEGTNAQPCSSRPPPA